MEELTHHEKISTFISILELLLIFGGFYYAGHQLRQARKTLRMTEETNRQDLVWSKKMAADAALAEYSSRVVLDTLQSTYDYLNCKEPIPLATIEDGFKSHPSVQADLMAMLNFYERLARGVSLNMYDEDVVKAARKTAMTKAYTSFEAFIKERRIKNASPNAWIKLENIVRHWASDNPASFRAVS